MNISSAYPNLAGSLFIVTYGRSGSTVLQRILQTVPKSCIRGENADSLSRLFESYSLLRDARESYKLTNTREPANPWYGYEDIDLAGYGEDLTEVFVRRVLHPSPDTRWIGFKEIRWGRSDGQFAHYLDFISQFFPAPYFIFNSRGHQAVAKSGWFRNWKPETVREFVERMDGNFRRYHDANPERCFLARHEETVADPSYLADLFRMIGERFDIAAIRTVLDRQLNH